MNKEVLLAELWEASKHPSVNKDYRNELQIRMGRFLNSLPDDKEIAKRKIEEFVEERKPTHPAFIAGIASILHWLDSREDK